MIYTAAKNLVTETFVRRIRTHGQEYDQDCIRLKDGIARTLAADRYTQLLDEDEIGEQRNDYRRLTCEGIEKGERKPREKLAAWRAFVLSLIGNNSPSPSLLFAWLQSRLMVNMAGSVLENGGLCLDRTSGVPYIPGSASKGCARRGAIEHLRETSETSDKAVLLERIGWVFGWSDLEWKDREDSDFAGASGQAWPAIRQTVATNLCTRLGLRPTSSDRAWESLPHFAGSIAFLPVYPWDGDPGIELDVVTGHHRRYHENPDPTAVARDIEEPVPVVFPAVSSAGRPRFAFILYETTRALPGDLAAARSWLAEALELFGIGAKTSAGYGRFIAEEREALVRLQEQAQLQDTRKIAEAAQLREKSTYATAKPGNQSGEMVDSAPVPAIPADPALMDRFSRLKPTELRSCINKFQFDEQFWPVSGEESTPKYQVSLYLFLTETSPTLYLEVKNDSKSKMLRALKKLAAKYGYTLPN